MAEATKTASLDAGYATRGLPPPPQVSVTTIPMAGLLVDVYGLEELRPSVPVSCLWLLHPRTRTRARMRDIASRVVGAYNDSNDAADRGLVALAFDMPNHGTRMVSEAANGAWDEGNERHAVDMMGAVKGGRCDMSGLMDVAEGYLGREVRGHACLGWSLGGHAAWQAWVREERLDAVVVVVGCPDFPGALTSPFPLPPFFLCFPSSSPTPFRFFFSFSVVLHESLYGYGQKGERKKREGRGGGE